MPPEIHHALEVSGAAILLHHAERDTDVAASKFGNQLPKGVIRFEAGDRDGLHYEELVAKPPSNNTLPALDLAAPAFIYFTSGTTGKPKGVVHLRHTDGCMMAALIQGMEITAADTLLPGLSFSHIAGSLGSVAILATGGRLLIPCNTEGSELLPLLRQHRPTVLWMLPAALITLVRDHDADSTDFASIRLARQAGIRSTRNSNESSRTLPACPLTKATA